MTGAPPSWATLLPRACAAPADAEAIAGDLAEELGAVARQRGSSEARCWYGRQVMRSAPELAAMRARREGWGAALVIAAVTMALPLVLSDRLWPTFSRRSRHSRTRSR